MLCNAAQSAQCLRVRGGVGSLYQHIVADFQQLEELIGHDGFFLKGMNRAGQQCDFAGRHRNLHTVLLGQVVAGPGVFPAFGNIQQPLLFGLGGLIFCPGHGNRLGVWFVPEPVHIGLCLMDDAVTRSIGSGGRVYHQNIPVMGDLAVILRRIEVLVADIAAAEQQQPVVGNQEFVVQQDIPLPRLQQVDGVIIPEFDIFMPLTVPSIRMRTLTPRPAALRSSANRQSTVSPALAQ